MEEAGAGGERMRGQGKGGASARVGARGEG